MQSAPRLAVLVILLALLAALVVWGLRSVGTAPVGSTGEETDVPAMPQAVTANGATSGSEGGSGRQAIGPAATGLDVDSDPGTCLVRFLVRTPDGERVSSGTLHYGYHDGDVEHYDVEELDDGDVALRVPPGSRLLEASVEPEEMELPQLDWTAGSIRTSGFLEWDASEEWFEDESFERRIDADRDFTITVSEGLVVSGRVLDASTGRGVAGAWVLVSERFDSIGAQSGPDGSFRIAGRAPLDPDFDPELAVSAVHPSYRAQRLVFFVDEVIDPLGGIQLRMEPGVHLEGTVVDSIGTPVPGATVRLMAERRVQGNLETTAGLWTTAADEHGGFDLWGLPATEHAEIEVVDLRHGRATGLHGPFSLLTDVAGLVVTVPSHALLQLTATLPDGSPIDPYRCLATLSIDGEPARTVAEIGQPLAVPLGRASVCTVVHESAEDAWLGRLELTAESTAAVERRVVLRRAEPTDPRAGAGESLLEPGEQVSRSRMDVRSPLLGHGFVVQCIEAGTAARPITGRSLRFTLSTGGGGAALNDRGRTLLLVPPGVHSCRFEVDGYLARHCRLRAPIGGQSSLRLEFTREK